MSRLLDDDNIPVKEGKNDAVMNMDPMSQSICIKYFEF